MRFDRDRVVTLVTLLLVALALALWATSPAGPLAGLLHPLEYETTAVTVSDENGTTLATVEVRVADTDRERYVGLSETDSLADGEGMLFVFDDEADRAFVMRNMSFPLDIVFADAGGTITTIRHAAVPPEGTSGGDLQRYRGRGKYVLEMPRGFTNATGITVGDNITVPEGVSG